MRLLKFLKFMSLITVLTVIYINMQMQIFTLAYEGKQKEKDIIEISEKNGMIAYDILKLKSSNHLGEKLLTEDSELKFRDRDSVIQLITTENIDEKPAELSSIKPKRFNAVLSFLAPKAEAQAKTIDERDLIKPWRRKNSR